MVKGKVKNIISEDDIEQTLVQRLQCVYGIDSLNCFTAKPEDLNDGSGRTDKRDVIFADRLREACFAINPDIPEKVIDEQVIDKIADRRAAMNPIAANRELDKFIRDGVPVEFDDVNGRKQKETVKLIDFNHPSPQDGPNKYLVVTQLWI